jgi:hypothetical protein
MKIRASILLVLTVALADLLSASAAQPLAAGLVKRELFLSITGTAVTDLTSSPQFTNNQPDSVSLFGSLEMPTDAGSDYGQRVSGLLVPSVTGAYVFFIASDDQSELWLSTDDNPANKQLIASVTQFTNSREWNKYPDTQNNALAPVQLVAGTPYYLEALMKQGGGGDNLAVGWVLPGQYVDPNNPPDGLTNITIIPGANLRAIVGASTPTMMVTSQPQPQVPVTPISDGDANPSTVKGTDLGSTGVKKSVLQQSYTIYNLGQVNLGLSGNPVVAVTGANAGDFVVTTQPATPILPGGSSTFTVQFVPSAPGPRKASVSIAHADSPTNAFEFAIQGSGLGGGAGVLGNDSEGVTWVAIDNSQIQGNRFQSPHDMQIKELHAKLIELAGTFKCAVYSDTNGAADRLLQSSVEVVNATNGWNTFALTAPLNLAAGEYYWLVIWADTVGARVQYDASGVSSWGSYAYADLGGQWPDPISLNGGQNTRTYCIYAEGIPIGTVAGPAIDIRGNGKLIVSGDSTPSLLDGSDFGSLGVGGGTKDQTFTIENPGDTALVLTGAPPVSITGPQAADFTVTSPPSASVAAGGSANFTVRFHPSVRGLRTATLNIANNNPSDNPYTFALQGAGYLTGQESIWPDTKTGKQWVENTDYELGMIFQSSVSGKITHIRVYSVAGERGDHTARIWRDADETVIAGPFTWNYGGVTGWITLDIPDVAIDANTEYTVVVSTGSLVKNYPNIAADVAHGSDNGQHLSYPDNAGVFSMVLGERPTTSYNGGNYLRDIVFVPAGATVDLPSMEVRGNSLSITNGDQGPLAADSTDFGQAATGGGIVEHTFTIANTGAAPLNLTGVPMVVIGGAQTNDFSVTVQPNSPISPGGSSTFVVRFAPSQTGARNATVSINNDSDQSPYAFAITGVGIAAVTGPKIVEIKPNLATGDVTVRWEGQGSQFQVEKAADVTGPFTAVGAQQATLSFTDSGGLKANARGFYRVRVVSP